MSRKAAIVALVLPLLAIGLGIVRAELFLSRAREFVFEIEGFDPRDLLRGHYLQFRLRLPSVPEREACVDDGSGSCCLCLTRRGGADEPVAAERSSCATARASCDGALLTHYANTPQRFYVPEARARELEVRLRAAMAQQAAHAVLAVDAKGNAVVRELRIDGVAITGSRDRP